MNKETEDVNYASLKLKVPDSGIDWLDEMITKSLRDYFAAKVLQGICASGPSTNFSNARIAAEAYVLADAMLEVKEMTKLEQAARLALETMLLGYSGPHTAQYLEAIEALREALSQPAQIKYGSQEMQITAEACELAEAVLDAREYPNQESLL